jgi:hypothetical protein
VHAYLAETLAAGRIAEFHREAALARLAADVPRTARTHRLPSLGTRFASWAERPRAGRSQGVCCPA